jgi:hypothetical protein
MSGQHLLLVTLYRDYNKYRARQLELVILNIIFSVVSLIFSNPGPPTKTSSSSSSN